MKSGMRWLGFLVLLLTLFLFFPREARAYLDLGTGSYVLQMLVATLLGGVYALKLYWKRVVEFMRGKIMKKPYKESLSNNVDEDE